MTNVSRIVKVNPDELPADLVELGNALNRLPSEYRQTVESLYGRVVESTRRRRRILSLVQDVLAQLRLDMKYLMFDLEATRARTRRFPPQSRRSLNSSWQQFWWPDLDPLTARGACLLRSRHAPRAVGERVIFKLYHHNDFPPLDKGISLTDNGPTCLDRN